VGQRGHSKVRWDKEGTVRLGGTKRARYEQGILFFFLWKKQQKSLIGNGIFSSPQNIISS